MYLDLSVRVIAELGNSAEDADPVNISALSDILEFESFKLFVASQRCANIVNEGIVNLALLNSKDSQSWGMSFHYIE